MQNGGVRRFVAVQRRKYIIDGTTAVDRKYPPAMLLANSKYAVEHALLDIGMSGVAGRAIQSDFADISGFSNQGLKEWDLMAAFMGEFRMQSEGCTDVAASFCQRRCLTPGLGCCGYRQHINPGGVGFGRDLVGVWVEIKMAVEIDHVSKAL
jgi:hypothetical protein